MIQISNRDFPFASLHLYFRTGARFDPEGLEGLTWMTAQMMLRGAGDRDRQTFTEALDGLGGSIDIGVGRDTVGVDGDTLTRNLPEWMELLSDALCRPRFEADELERLRRQALAENDERRDTDEDLCAHIIYQELHRPDPAGRSTRGTAESLRRITLDDVKACYERVFTRGEMIAGACGDLGDDFEGQLNAALQLPDGEPHPLTPYVSEDPGRVRVILIDKPERTQTQIMGGRLALGVGHPDHFPLMVANTVFGGTFTARLSREIREKRGWSYGASSSLVPRRTMGTWHFRFYPAAKDAVDALALGLDLHREWAETGITEEELAFAQSYLVNRFPFHLQTPKRRLVERLRLELLDLPSDETSRYVSKVEAVTVDAANTAVRTHLPAGDLTVVMVCTASGLADRIAALDSVDSVEVHPFDVDW